MAKKIKVTAAPAPPAAPIVEKRFLQSRDVGKALEVEPPEFKPFDRGPQTGEASAVLLADRDFVSKFATDEEAASFRAVVQLRKEREGSVGWRVLPSGVRILSTMILAICDRCGAGTWVKSATGPCLTCNYQRRVDGGHLHVATASEEAAWFESETIKVRNYWARLPEAERELDEFNRRRLQDLPRDRFGKL